MNIDQNDDCWYISTITRDILPNVLSLVWYVISGIYIRKSMQNNILLYQCYLFTMDLQSSCTNGCAC